MTLLKVLILLILFLFPFGELLRFQINNHVAIKPIDVMVGMTALWWIIWKVQSVKFKVQSFNIKYKVLKKSSFALPFILFVSVGFISLVINLTWLEMNQFLVSSLYWFRWVSYALLFPIVLQFDKIFKQKICLFLLIDGLIIVFLGYLQYFFYNSLKNVYHLGWDEHMHRMVSTFLDPNFAGAFFVLYLLFVGGMLARNHESRIMNQGVLIGILVLTLAAIFLTFSRSALLMLIVGAVSFLFLINKKKFVLLLFAVIVLFGLVVSPKFYDENMNLFREASSKARLENYAFALRVIEDHPVVGVGFNSYRYTKPLYGADHDWVDSPSHADAGVDNSFLFVLATTGIIGSFCYVWFWLRLLRRLQGVLRKKKNILAVVTFSSVIGLFVHALFVNSLFFAPLMLWYFMLIGLSLEKTSP